MKNKRARITAWGLAGLAIAGSVYGAATWMARLSGRPTFYDSVEALGWGLALPLIFSVLAALIISRQPGNRVGWLMMVIALAQGTGSVLNWVLEPLAAAPPSSLTAGIWLLLFVRGAGWVPVIFPVFLIPLYFPTGRPPTPRWRWVARLNIGMMVTFTVLAALTATIDTPNWSIPNPIGFIPESFWEGGFMLVWTAGLITAIGGSVASLYVRYRKASSVERQQIKVLLLAGVLFGVFFTASALLSNGDAFSENGWLDLLFVLTILGLPVAIAIAIFRYRLWDLDVVINRALIYGPLTTFMAGTFAMVIALTSELTKEVLGDQSKALGAAISAVIVAVVFQPLRSRIEAFVDKHFYPQKLDLASGLVEVMPEYWSFLDRETLMGLAMEHVRGVLGTEHAAFYLATGPDRFELAAELNGAAHEHPAFTLSKKQRDELQKKRVVASEGMAKVAGHVPLFIDRGKSNELLGLLSVGSRTNGKGYSGDDLKGLVELGNKIGLALNAIDLRDRTNHRSNKWAVESPGTQDSRNAVAALAPSNSRPEGNTR